MVSIRGYFKINQSRSLSYSLHIHTFIDAIDDCPEFLIHQPTMIAIAKEYGLRIILLETFHDFYEQEKSHGADLLDRMRVFNQEGTISKEEWEAIGIYCVFAFEKIN